MWIMFNFSWPSHYNTPLHEHCLRLYIYAGGEEPLKPHLAWGEYSYERRMGCKRIKEKEEKTTKNKKGKVKLLQ
jgi:hypothetical protein